VAAEVFGCRLSGRGLRTRYFASFAATDDLGPLPINGHTPLVKILPATAAHAGDAPLLNPKYPLITNHIFIRELPQSGVDVCLTPCHANRKVTSQQTIFFGKDFRSRYGVRHGIDHRRQGCSQGSSEAD
jgi:hypothetical protein